jgi:hypothetical protein
VALEAGGNASWHAVHPAAAWLVCREPTIGVLCPAERQALWSEAAWMEAQAVESSAALRRYLLGA